MKEVYLIIDIGTGNVRVAMSDINLKILGVETDNVHYEKDANYPSALYFDPDYLWGQIETLTKKLITTNPYLTIRAITVSSQREGVVLMNSSGDSLIGLPNHDHRGREWENTINDKDLVYQLAGRYPTSLFPALKIIGIKKRRPELFSKFSKLLSISDWAQYKLSGIYGYEHSQASETLLYDIQAKNWSSELCSIFGINKTILPKLYNSGEVLGKILPSCATSLNISTETVIIVGGSDTQLAIKSTTPAPEDIIIVSGTTTPIVKIMTSYMIDPKQRTWTNRHIDSDHFVLETNAGVTGLNYQNSKRLFYTNESYNQIEQEISSITNPQCLSFLGSLIAGEKEPMSKGGFIFEVPVSQQLSRASFMWAILFEIACSIKENFEILQSVSKYQKDYIWICGGGFQSPFLRQLIASLLNKKLRIRKGYSQASVIGAAIICNESLNPQRTNETEFDEIDPNNQDHYMKMFEDWKKNRKELKKIF